MSKTSKARKAKLNRNWSHIPVAQRKRIAKDTIRGRAIIRAINYFLWKAFNFFNYNIGVPPKERIDEETK